jgi:hypothetical protein
MQPRQPPWELRASSRRALAPIVAVVNLSLTQCPYDGALLDAEISSGGLMLLICASCDAAWETHGSYVGRVRDPNRDKIIAARDAQWTETPANGGHPI